MSLSKQRFRQAGLSDHRRQGLRTNVVADVMECNRHHTHLSIYDAAILPVARRLMPVFAEPMRLNDCDELSKGALQARQDTGNPTVALVEARPGNMAATRKRRPHVKRTENGARRRRSCERAGSGSANAQSTYPATARSSWSFTSSNERPCTARSRSRQNASHSPWCPRATQNSVAGPVSPAARCAGVTASMS
jgi:hypothetical protein